MNQPRARVQGIDPNQAGKETDLFLRGISWALCFFSGDNPHVQEFRAPQAGDLTNQSVSVHVPYHYVHPFAGYIRHGAVAPFFSSSSSCPPFVIGIVLGAVFQGPGRPLQAPRLQVRRPRPSAPVAAYLLRHLGPALP
ncbi:hypothetical protein GGR55DRAFT_678540 [Xylaria sp. FL0064]|nr:hypothetical protein GGR55DRAFT_678540 [Xylaria sp. FL0064]